MERIKNLQGFVDTKADNKADELHPASVSLGTNEDEGEYLSHRHLNYKAYG